MIIFVPRPADDRTKMRNALEHEPEWQEVARARIDSGLTDFTVTLRYADDFGVNVKLEAVNVKVGGHFEEFSAEEWVICGRFAKKPFFGR